MCVRVRDMPSIRTRVGVCVGVPRVYPISKNEKIHKQKMSLSEYTSTPCRVREEEGGGRGGKMETTEQCAATPVSGVGEGLGFR